MLTMTSHRVSLTSYARVFALLPFLVLATHPCLATPDLASQLLARGLSHLAPHLFPLPPTTTVSPPASPPAALLAPLDPAASVIKGLDPVDEQVLAGALLALPLRQRLMKVAVAEAAGKRLALIKLQAGDIDTHTFLLDDLEDDAVSALRVAFALPLQLDEVDLWSVVPGEDRTGLIHMPVFSLCANRADFESADNSPRPAAEILSHLGLIRFAPEFLRYAGGVDSRQVLAQLPATAWDAAPVANSWKQMVAASQHDPRLAAAALARVIVHIPVTDNSVALTIDDGPHPFITSLFLDILRKYGVRATFFVVGEKVEECPELLRRMVDEGNEIGNHTYSHPRLSKLSEPEALAQIRACELVVGRVCGRPLHLLRPPGGGITADVLRAATAANCSVVLWTNNTNDWTKPPPQEIVDNALRDLKPGDIILMHEGDIRSVEALPRIIEGVRARGMRLTTVGDMLSRAPVPVVPISDIMALYHEHELKE